VFHIGSGNMPLRGISGMTNLLVWQIFTPGLGGNAGPIAICDRGLGSASTTGILDVLFENRHGSAPSPAHPMTSTSGTPCWSRQPAADIDHLAR